MVTGAFSNSYRGAQSAAEVSLVLRVCGLAARSRTYGLGQDSTIIINSELISFFLVFTIFFTLLSPRSRIYKCPALA